MHIGSIYSTLCWTTNLFVVIGDVRDLQSFVSLPTVHCMPLVGLLLSITSHSFLPSTRGVSAFN